MNKIRLRLRLVFRKETFDRVLGEHMLLDIIDVTRLAS